MIIKTKSIKASTGGNVTAYVQRIGENESIEILDGDPLPLEVADDFACAEGRENGLLHITISPDQDLTPKQLAEVIEDIRSEFGIAPDDPHFLVKHSKNRADGSAPDHYHLILPAQNQRTGKTYDLWQSKRRDETLSRAAELKFGHKITLGKHTDFAVDHLRQQDRDDLADLLFDFAQEQQFDGGDSFSHPTHMKAEREGLDLPALRQDLRDIARLDRDEQAQALAELMHEEGFVFGESDRNSRIILRKPGDDPDATPQHNANRQLKIPTAETANFIKQTGEKLNELKQPQQPKPDPASDHDSQPADSNNRPTERPAAADQQGDRGSLNNSFPPVSDCSIGPPPDLDDPNLMLKLSAALKKSMASSGPGLKPG